MRKGLMNSFVVALIVFLLSFGVVGYLLVRSGILVNSDADMNLCRATLAIQANTKVLHFWNSPLSSDCHRRFIDVGTTSITTTKPGAFSVRQAVPVYLPPKTGASAVAATVAKATSSGTGSTPTGPALERRTTFIVTEDPAAMQSFAAESMRRCWQMGLEGQMKIFDEKDLMNMNVCLLCDQVNVKRGTADPIMIKDFANYLETTVMPVLTPGAGAKTYAEYFDLVGPGAHDSLPYAADCRSKLNIDDTVNLQDGTYATVLVHRFGFFDRAGCSTTAFVSTARIGNLCQFIAN